MLSDEALDGIAEAIERALASGERVDVAALAAAFGVEPQAVDDMQRAMAALSPEVVPAPNRLDRYRIEAELGRGGMGVVYRAHDTVLNRAVAIKTVRIDRADPRRFKRFRRELLALGRLDHPNVVRTLSSGEHAGRAFVVLQLIEGRSLADRLREGGPLDAGEAVDLCATLADALEAVHAAGVLHRDVKPANVLLTREGAPVLTDFGLTREIDPVEWSRLSRTGHVLGSPGFWAPEQAAGKPTSEATDVYGLGAVLYACLTGEPPTSASGVALEAMAAAVSGSIVSPADYRSDLDPELVSLCMACLELDPAARPAGAGAVADRLRALAVVSPPAARPLALAALAVLSALAVVLLGGVAAVALSRDGSPPEATPNASPAEVVAAPPPPSRERALVQSLLEKGQECLARGEFLPGLENADAILARDPDHFMALLLRSELNRQTQSLDAALADAGRATELDPLRADAWVQLAICHGSKGNLSASIETSTRALELDPDLVAAYMERGASRALSGDSDGSIADYSEAIVRNPRNETARLRRGATRFMRRDFAGAIEDCTEALEVGNHHKAWEIRAEARYRLNDFEGAESDSVRAAETDPTCPAPLVSRGKARWKLGKLEAAVGDLTAGIALFTHPQDPRRGETQQLLDQVRLEQARARSAEAAGLGGE